MSYVSRESWVKDYMRLMDDEYGDYGFCDDPVPSYEEFADDWDSSEEIDTGDSLGDRIAEIIGTDNSSSIEKIEYNEWTATYYENIVRGEMNMPLRDHYYKKEVAPGIYEGFGENILRDGKSWKPRKASSIF